MRQQYALGRQLFNTYVNTSNPFLSRRYSSKEVCELTKSLGNAMNFQIYVRSTDVNRTLISAYANLAGMFAEGVNGTDYPDYFRLAISNCIGRRPPCSFSGGPTTGRPFLCTPSMSIKTMYVNLYSQYNSSVILFLLNLIPKYPICGKFEISHFYMLKKFIIADRERVCALSSGRRALQSSHFLSRIQESRRG